MASELDSIDLVNGKLDIDHIAELATSNAPRSIDRFGVEKKTWAGLEEELNSAAAATAVGTLTSTLFDRVYPGIQLVPPTARPISGDPCGEGDSCFILTAGVPRRYAFIDGFWSLEIVDGVLLGAAGGASRVGTAAAGAGARLRTLQDKANESVSVDDYFQIGEADYTGAFERASLYLASRGGGRIRCPGSFYEALYIILRRYITICGEGTGATEIRQRAGANRDFIVSENFYALIGSGAAAATDARVPSFAGLEDLRYNGNRYNATTNPTGNTVGHGFCWYGPAPIVRRVIGYNCAQNGAYTQYTNVSGSSGWQGQEEGEFTDFTLRDNGERGWLFQGPHNSKMNAIVVCFNGIWGFENQSGANFDGGIDWVGHMHSYANGRSVSPALDTGICLGEIIRAGTIITDGDNLKITASNCNIGHWRGYNIGGLGDGLEITGNANTIGTFNAVMWANSVGRTGFKIFGSRNSIGPGNLVTNNPDNDAILMTGNSNKIGPVYLQGFSAAGRIGMNLGGTKNRVVAEITGCATAFNYTAGSNNEVDLEITTSAGQVAVAGSGPGVADRFNIRASGTTAGGTRTAVQSGTVPMDITAAQTITFPHGLLYTPSRAQCSISLLDSSPTSTAYVIAYMRVASTDATNVTVNLRLSVAAAAGTLARIGLIANI